jgi:hypothetical protein
MKWSEREKILNNLPTPTDESLIGEYKKNYGNMSHFNIQYYQGIVDIEGNLLKVGDTVYYVFGKGLETGIIEEILPYKIGFLQDRIKIKGKKRYFYSTVMVKKN